MRYDACVALEHLRRIMSLLSVLSSGGNPAKPLVHISNRQVRPVAAAAVRVRNAQLAREGSNNDPEKAGGQQQRQQSRSLTHGTGNDDQREGSLALAAERSRPMSSRLHSSPGESRWRARVAAAQMVQIARELRPPAGAST